MCLPNQPKTSQILAAEPECLFPGGMFDQVAVLLKPARQKGFKGVCLSDDGFDSADAAVIGGDAPLDGGGTIANDDKIPTRDAVPEAVRRLKDFHGSTGTMTFNVKGDLSKAKHFIIQVTSADPQKWASNRIDTTLDVTPPPAAAVVDESRLAPSRHAEQACGICNPTFGFRFQE